MIDFTGLFTIFLESKGGKGQVRGWKEYDDGRTVIRKATEAEKITRRLKRRGHNVKVTRRRLGLAYVYRVWIKRG